MTLVLTAIVAVAAGLLAGYLIARKRRRTVSVGAGRVHRILLPFTG